MAEENDKTQSDFREYLEREGVVDTLTSVLVGLYEKPDRPKDPLNFVQREVGLAAGLESEVLRRENETLKEQVKFLEDKVRALESKVEALER